MRQQKYLAGLTVLTAVFLIALQPKAYAYLDPGSSGFFIQMLIAAFVGLSFTIKAFWQKIKDFFTRLFHGKTPPQA